MRKRNSLHTMSYQIVHAKRFHHDKIKLHVLGTLLALCFLVIFLVGCGKMPPAVDPPPESGGAKTDGVPRHYPDIKTDPSP